MADTKDEILSKKIIEPEERLRIVREKQNEERQKKLEELKAQAFAAQKFREQKEEERRKRIEELKCKDTDRRQQVEERKRAIEEAEKERREYILHKYQERDAKLDTKKRDRNSGIFAFGSSTPRMLDSEFSTSPSVFWNHRRSTSISNVSYIDNNASRRSCERETVDASKKRASSASGLDRQSKDHQRMSTSMYEIFHWGPTNDEHPKKLHFTLAGSHIDIDEKPLSRNNHVIKENNNTQTYRSVARRKTDLMPTMPSPRDACFGSKSSLISTPRTAGRTLSMTRLDQLAKPLRYNGEHIRSIMERERRNNNNNNNDNDHLLLIIPSSHHQQFSTKNSSSVATSSSSSTFKKNNRISRSMVNISQRQKQQQQLHNQQFSTSTSMYSNATANHKKHYDKNKSLFKAHAANLTKSLSQLLVSSNNNNNNQQQHNLIKNNNYNKPQQQQRTSINKKLLINNQQQQNQQQQMMSTGSRSGDITPKSIMNSSRPNSALSSATSTSAIVYRRPKTSHSPRPASIAVTGVSHLLGNANSYDKTDRPPLPTKSSHHLGMKKAQPNLMTQSFRLERTHPSSLMSQSMRLEKTNSISSSVKSLDSRPPRSGDKQTSSKPSTPNKSKSIDLNGAKSKHPKLLSTQITPKKELDDSNVTPKREPKPKVVPAPVPAATPELITISDNKEEKVKLQETNGGDVMKPEIDQQQQVNREQEIAEQQQVATKNDKNLQNNVVIEQLIDLIEVNKNEASSDKSDIIEICENVAEKNNFNINNNNMATVTNNISKNFIEKEILSAVADEKCKDKEEKQIVNNNIKAEQQQTNEQENSETTGKQRITNEEEAKAAIAERRRLAREEAERQAELERQRLEAEAEAERQRQLHEEEMHRRLEEETNRLAEEQRLAEETRLQQAIEEAQKRDEIERLRREEEAKQKIEREEQERKAREEAEKQKIETAERLKKEEKEREERRKRVEAIMSRTRSKNGTPSNTPSKTSDNESNNKQIDDNLSQGFDENNLITSTTETTAENVELEQTDLIINTQILVDDEENNINRNNNIINNNNNNDNNNINLISYEQQVTEKENFLLSSFNTPNTNSTNVKRNILNNTSSNNSAIVVGDLLQQTNGKQQQHNNIVVDTTATLLPAFDADDNIIIIDNINTKNGHINENTIEYFGARKTDLDKNITNDDGSINVLLNEQQNAINLLQQKQQQLQQQQHIDDNINLNNNKTTLENLITTTANNALTLVTSDSQLKQDISLL